MGAAGARTFEWAGNSSGVLRRRGRVAAAVSKGRGLWNRVAEVPGSSRLPPSRRVRQVRTLPENGPASPRKRCGGRVRWPRFPGGSRVLGETTGARRDLGRSVRRNRDREAEDLETRSERTCSARRATPPAAALTLRSRFCCQHCFQKPSPEDGCHCLCGRNLPPKDF